MKKVLNLIFFIYILFSLVLAYMFRNGGLEIFIIFATEVIFVLSLFYYIWKIQKKEIVKLIENTLGFTSALCVALSLNAIQFSENWIIIFGTILLALITAFLFIWHKVKYGIKKEK
jgi:lysylphosphatidylglycerol synthetase-like protein (DUF2156 family)